MLLLLHTHELPVYELPLHAEQQDYKFLKINICTCNARAICFCEIVMQLFNPWLNQQSVN